MDNYEIFYFSPITYMYLAGQGEREIADRSYLFRPVAEFLDRFNPNPMNCTVTVIGKGFVARTISLPEDRGVCIMLPFDSSNVPLSLYMFAHEYCHRTIYHRFSGSCHVLEEIVSTVASLMAVGEARRRAFGQGRSEEGAMWELTVRYILSGYRQEIQLLRREGIRILSLSTRSPSDYAMYEAAAIMLYPLFCENPNLWGILRHMGDIDPASSFEGYLSGLRESADGSYRESLDKMIALLLP